MSVLARHPFINSGHLAKMLGVSVRQAQYLLASAKPCVGEVRPRLPGRPLRLYYLRGPVEAGMKGLSPEAARRYLHMAGTIHAVRSLLLRLPGYSWEELYPAPGRRGLTYHALLRVDGRPVAAMEWDSGLKPRSLFRIRLRRLLGLPFARAGSRPYTPPPPLLPLVLVTPALRVEEALRMASEGRVPAAVAVLEEVRRGGDLQVQTAGGKESLASWLATLPRRDGSAYPERRLYFADDWDEKAVLFLNLAPREKSVMSLVTALPLLSEEQVAALSSLRPVQVRRVLRGLVRKGCLQKEGGRYLPGVPGLEMMAEMAGSTLRGYARARNYHLVGAGDGLRVDVPALRRAIEHTAVERFLAASLARQLGPRWTWHDEREAIIPFYYHGTWRLSPDALIAGEEADIFLEVDRVSPVGRIRQKVLRYYFYRAAGGRPFLLLVLVEIPHRAGLWLDAAQQTAEEHGWSRIPILVALLSDVARRSVRGRVWAGYDRRLRPLAEAMRRYIA